MVLHGNQQQPEQAGLSSGVIWPGQRSSPVIFFLQGETDGRQHRDASVGDGVVMQRLSVSRWRNRRVQRRGVEHHQTDDARGQSRCCQGANQRRGDFLRRWVNERLEETSKLSQERKGCLTRLIGTTRRSSAVPAIR